MRPLLRNGRGRIRCYWCKWDAQEETGPWAITTEYFMDENGYIPVCYNHSYLPVEKARKEILERRKQWELTQQPT